MAAHCLARYRFRLNRVIYFILFSTIIFPPQITIISLFQILVQYGLYDTRVGLTLVYVAIQLPLTIYILESFFARIPTDLFDAARIDGYSEWEIFWRVSFPIALPAIATTVILNFILLWNEFLYAVVLITDDANRTLPLGIQRLSRTRLATSAARSVCSGSWLTPGTSRRAWRVWAPPLRSPRSRRKRRPSPEARGRERPLVPSGPWTPRA